MLEDLDRIMEEAELDWIVGRGDPADSADLAFLLGGARVGHVTVLKRRGEAPFCVVGAMERDEARRAGLRFAVPNDYGAADIVALDIPPLEVRRRLLAAILQRHEVAGRTAFVGAGPINATFPVLRSALAACPAIEYVEEPHGTALSRARATKSAAEVERMRSVARRTEEVVREVLALLQRCRADGGALVQPDGAPLKIGHVKDVIAVELARRGLDDHGQTIFAAGREAGFPHSRGDEALPVPTGKPIIFDIFPCEKGGGYCFDMTRTYWVGAVPDAVREAYAAVAEAFEAAVAAVRIGAPGRALDDIACDVLERRGYVTKRSDPRTETGYMHSLGHGIGLEVHERPALSNRPANRDVLEAGHVFTIEPGLYEPDRELGIRIEDTLYLAPDGRVENLAQLPKAPELRVPGAGA